jgi:hypothetical protein
MPFQIDTMETAIEIASTGQPAEGTRREPVSPQAAPTASRAAVADAVGAVLSAELERFLKLRGMG